MSTEIIPLNSNHLKTLSDHPLVWLVILMSCVPYVVLSMNNLDAISAWFMPVTLAELIQPFSVWRLWTPTFVHYTLPHLLPNLYLWWLFASKIESESRAQLIVVVIISAAFANLSQWWLVGPNFGGLSGVVYALMGYVWIVGRFGNKAHYRFDNTLGILLLALIPLSATGIFGRFASFAHLGGLVCGVLLAFAYLALNREYKHA